MQPIGIRACGRAALGANRVWFAKKGVKSIPGRGPLSAVTVAGTVAGWDKAYTTIVDSNLTTVIAAIVLFMFGTGPIKGFAVTLTIGIATSMFTAITVTRALVNLVYGSRTNLKTLSIGGRMVQNDAAVALTKA